MKYMQKVLILIFLILQVSFLFAEGKRDSAIIQRNYAFTEFDSLSISGPFRVRVINSEGWDIHIACERSDLSSIKLRKNMNTFEISLKEGLASVGQPPVVVISMPLVLHIDLAGPVQMEVGGFSSDLDFTVSQESGSVLNISGFECSKADFLISGLSILHAFLSSDDIHIFNSGSNEVRMGGRSENLFIESEGRSRIDGSLLLVDYVKMQLSGMAEIRITPDKQMHIISSDQAIIYYNDDYMDTIPVSEGNAILRKY